MLFFLLHTSLRLHSWRWGDPSLLERQWLSSSPRLAITRCTNFQFFDGAHPGYSLSNMIDNDIDEFYVIGAWIWLKASVLIVIGLTFIRGYHLSLIFISIRYRRFVYCMFWSVSRLKNTVPKGTKIITQAYRREQTNYANKKDRNTKK